MSTTVIVIKGNSSQSLLDRIADALKSEKEKEQDLYKAQATQFINEMNAVLPRVAIALQQQEQPIARQKAPYTKRYHFDENQERLVKQYLRKNKTFKFGAIKSFLKAAGYEKIHNRDLMVCLNKNNVEKVYDADHKTFWTTSKITK
jgi:hypothetical protein